MPQLEKPDTCIVCYEKLGIENPLVCGHWVHLACVKKHFKPECPICRTTLDVKVNGTRPVEISVEEEILLPREADHARIRRSVAFLLADDFSMSEDMRNFLLSYPYLLGNEMTTPVGPVSQVFDEAPAELDEVEALDGYLYPEENPEYDEENPKGDDWDYEDV